MTGFVRLSCVIVEAILLHGVNFAAMQPDNSEIHSNQDLRSSIESLKNVVFTPNTPNPVESSEKEVERVSLLYSDYHLLHVIIICSTDTLRELPANAIANQIFIDKLFPKLSASGTFSFMGVPMNTLKYEAVNNPEKIKERLINFFDRPIDSIKDEIIATKKRYPRLADKLDSRIQATDDNVLLMRAIALLYSGSIFKILL